MPFADAVYRGVVDAGEERVAVDATAVLRDTCIVCIEPLPLLFVFRGLFRELLEFLSEVNETGLSSERRGAG